MIRCKGLGGHTSRNDLASAGVSETDEDPSVCFRAVNGVRNGGVHAEQERQIALESWRAVAALSSSAFGIGIALSLLARSLDGGR